MKRYIILRTDDMGSLHSGFFPYQSNGRSD